MSLALISKSVVAVKSICFAPLQECHCASGSRSNTSSQRPGGCKICFASYFWNQTIHLIRTYRWLSFPGMMCWVWRGSSVILMLSGPLSTQACFLHFIRLHSLNDFFAGLNYNWCLTLLCQTEMWFCYRFPTPTPSDLADAKVLCQVMLLIKEMQH